VKAVDYSDGNADKVDKDRYQRCSAQQSDEECFFSGIDKIGEMDASAIDKIRINGIFRQTRQFSTWVSARQE